MKPETVQINKTCLKCLQSRTRWQELFSCEESRSDHYKHIIHWSHPICKEYVPRDESEAPK